MRRNTLNERKDTFGGSRVDLFRYRESLGVRRNTLNERRKTLTVRRNTLGGSCETLFGCRVGVCVRREAR